MIDFKGHRIEMDSGSLLLKGQDLVDALNDGLDMPIPPLQVSGNRR